MKPDSEPDSPIPSVAPKVESAFNAFVGALPEFSTREEINAWLRDLREDDLDDVGRQ
jgi:hypothetical protein